jgi:lipid A 3-O-deacylase
MPLSKPLSSAVLAGLLAFLPTGLAGGGEAFAQEAEESELPPPDDRWAVTGVLENDLFTGTDRHYTNGVLASALSPQDETLGLPPELWDWLPGHDANSKERVGLLFGQSMFTPNDIGVSAAQPDERPWSAWLHGGISLVSESKDELRTFTLDLGWVGPGALGEEAQSFVHSTIGSPEPQGWNNQIKNEPTVTLAYDHRWQNVLGLRPDRGLGFDLMPYVSGSLGNALTYAGGGATLRFGDDLPNDFGPFSIAPGTIGSPLYRPAGGFSWYLFAGAQGRAVARNIFLDGNTFQDSASVDKKPLVGDLYFGASMAYERVRLTYAYVIRSKEFDGQDAPDKFASITMTIKF